MEDAERLAEIISRDPHLAEWVKNYAYLIVGYVYYRKKDFEKSANHFEKITEQQILGHNTDKYWAASHFSRGLEFLHVDNKDDAFKSFRRSIGLRGATQENADLAPLFIHFGMKNIDAHNGSQALQAFTLLKESLTGVELNSATNKSLFAAEFGELLCQSLLDGPGDALPDGKDFTELLARTVNAQGGFTPTEQTILAFILHKMAICQVLRKQSLVSPHLRLKPSKLFAFLDEQTHLLEELQKQPESDRELLATSSKSIAKDPIILVLRALLELRWNERPDPKLALDLLTQAARLGLQSRSVLQLMTEIQKQRATAIEKKKAVLDLFDAYLIDGTLPPGTSI
jgi:tetratricopeptide (TPR) repeat protein